MGMAPSVDRRQTVKVNRKALGGYKHVGFSCSDTRCTRVHIATPAQRRRTAASPPATLSRRAHIRHLQNRVALASGPKHVLSKRTPGDRCIFGVFVNSSPQNVSPITNLKAQRHIYNIPPHQGMWGWICTAVPPHPRQDTQTKKYKIGDTKNKIAHDTRQKRTHNSGVYQLHDRFDDREEDR